MAEYLPFSKALRITDALGRIKRLLNLATGEGSGAGSLLEKISELTAVDQSGANGIYTVKQSDLIDSFAVGDDISYIDVSAKEIYSETLIISSIDRSNGQITTTGKFTAAPTTSDLLILYNSLSGTIGADITTYVLGLDVADQESDLLDAAVGIGENTKNDNAIHELVRALISALNSHYANGIDAQFEDHTNPVISNPTNSGNATVDIPDDEAKWFVAGDEVVYYDTSEGYRVLEHLPVSSVGAEGSGSASGTTEITLTGTWTTPPIAGDYLMIYDRLSPEFKWLCDKIGISLTAGRVFPEEVNMGTYAATGAASGAFTDDSTIDTDEYGGGDLEVEVINQAIGANDLVLAITGKYLDASGTEQTDSSASCTISGTSAVGVRVAVTPGVANARYHDITAVSNSNGNNGDDVKIVSKKDRLIRGD